MMSHVRSTALYFQLRLILAAALVIACGSAADAQVPLQYSFSYGTGAATDMTGASVLLGDDNGYDDVGTGVLPIGFTFVFQGVSYTEYSASSNGIIKLGASAVNGQFTNGLKTAGNNYPLIANYWEDLYLDTDPVGEDGGAAGIFSKVTGVPGARVLTVEWKARRFAYNSGPGEVPYSFQTRLYEGTNAIEYYYGSMSQAYPTSGSIGIATDTGRFMSVTPGWGAPLSAPTVSTTTPNDTINLQRSEARLPTGTTYRFTPIVMATFTSNGAPIGPGSALFTLLTSCVGDAAVSQPVTVTNNGAFDLIISDFNLYSVDSADQQGQMSLVRDSRGRLVPSSDYVVTDAPGTAPMQTNTPSTFPDTLGAGETRTFYVTFVGQRPGRRLSRGFIRTNANTFSGTDTNATPTLTSGLLAIDLVGQGVGARLARNLSGDRLRTLVFPDTRAGDTTVRVLSIVNSGACELRINRRRLRIFSGDVNEYRLLSVLPGVAVDNVRDDFVIAPGDSGTITVAFMPVRSGTRMATIFMQSNDSSLGIPGITEIGSAYVDLHGRGRAGLEARDLRLRPVVIGSFTNGIAEIENNSITTVDIARIYFEGLDSVDFAQDAIAGWPALPTRIVPGGTMRLGIRLTPAAASSAGIRRTTLVVVTTTGDTLRVRVRGEAGTQVLTVSPASLFENAFVTVGGSVRRTVMISNNGTLPVRLTSIVITGVDSVNYFLGQLPRRELVPGQTEFLEVTFAPENVGQSSAQLEISSNAGPTQIVMLGGTSTRVRRDPADPGTVAAPSPTGTAQRQVQNPSLR